MNLHALARSVVPLVNPDRCVMVQRYLSSTQNPDFSQTPAYDTFQATAQIQPLEQSDIDHLNGLNIQGISKAAYLFGCIDGINRPLGLGGDLITDEDGSVYLVKAQLEKWDDWVKVALCLQVS